MPFTGSHPAAVLPLMRTPLVPSALVIGSMSPDLWFYLALPDPVRDRLGELGHAPVGIVTLDLAAGLLAFVVWQLLLAPLAVAVAPSALRDRLGPDLPVPLARHLAGPRPVLLLLASTVIGALTHVVLDEFTHVNGAATRRIPWLAARHSLFPGQTFPGYYWGQLLGSVVGLGLIGWAGWRWWRRTVPGAGGGEVLARPVRVAVSALVSVCAAAGAVVGLRTALTAPGPTSLVFLMATDAGGAALAAALLCAVLVVPRTARLRAQDPAPGSAGAASSSASN